MSLDACEPRLCSQGRVASRSLTSKKLVLRLRGTLLPGGRGLCHLCARSVGHTQSLAFPTGSTREGCKGRGPWAGVSDTPHLSLPLPPKGRATLILIVKDGAWRPGSGFLCHRSQLLLLHFLPRSSFGAPLRARGVRASAQWRKSDCTSQGVADAQAGGPAFPGRTPQVAPGKRLSKGPCVRGLQLGRGCRPSPAPSSRSLHVPQLVSDAGNALYCPRVSLLKTAGEEISSMWNHLVSFFQICSVRHCPVIINKPRP